MSTTIYRVDSKKQCVPSFVMAVDEVDHWLRVLRELDPHNLYFVPDPEKNRLTAMG